LWILLFLSQYLKGQEYPISQLDIQTFAEEIFAVQDLDINYELPNRKRLNPKVPKAKGLIIPVPKVLNSLS